MMCGGPPLSPPLPLFLARHNGFGIPLGAFFARGAGWTPLFFFLFPSLHGGGVNGPDAPGVGEF